MKDALVIIGLVLMGALAGVIGFAAIVGMWVAVFAAVGAMFGGMVWGAHLAFTWLMGLL